MIGKHFRAWSALTAIYAGQVSAAPPAVTPDASTRLPGRSLVIVETSDLHFRPDEDVTTGDPNGFFFGGVYEANFKVLKTIGGDPIIGPVKIALAGSHLDRWRNKKIVMVMAVKRSATGEMWAGQHWQRFQGSVCLTDDDIRGWGVEPQSIDIRPDASGSRCIKA